MTVRKREKEKDMEKARKCLQIEQRILQAAFVLGLFSFPIIPSLTMTTEHWVRVELDVSRNASDKSQREKVALYHGLWKICRQDYDNSTGLALPGQSIAGKSLCNKLCVLVFSEIPIVEAQL